MMDSTFEDEIRQLISQLSTITDVRTEEYDDKLKIINQHLSQSNEKANQLCDILVEFNYAVTFGNLWRQLSDTYWSSQEKGEVVSRRVSSLLLLLCNSTDKSVAMCQQCLQHNVCKDFFKHLDNYSSQTAPYDMFTMLATLLNVEQYCEDAAEQYRLWSAVEIMKGIIKQGNVTLNYSAQLILASVITEDESESINMGSGTITYLLNVLSKALKDRDGKAYGYSADEILYGLNKLAVHDANKTRIVKLGGLPCYVEMLADHVSERGQGLAARGLWLMSFTCKTDVIREPGCIKGLETLAACGRSDSIRKEAAGALWVLREDDSESETHCQLPMFDMLERHNKLSVEDKMNARRTDSRRNRSHGPAGNMDTPHIMISYNWSHQSMLFKIRDRLVEAGYKVWMDVDKMTGSILEAMAYAVEESEVVLICYSQKYKESPACRTEAKYAFQLNKRIVPLKLQGNYKADGWLGILCGDKLYFDFSEEDRFQKSIASLFKELGDQGKLIKDQDQCIDKTNTSETAANPATEEKSNHRMWTSEQVMMWIEEQNLGKYKENYIGMDGELLLEYRDIWNRAPEFFFSRLHDMGMTMVDMTKLIRALKRL